ncbi:MAG: FecR family protein [Aggregatilineales bacterium]
MWRKILRFVLLIAIGVALMALAATLSSRYAMFYPVAHATLTVQRGSVQIVHADSRTFQAIPNRNSVVVSQDDVLTVSANGQATLHFNNETGVDLFPGSQLMIAEMRQANTSVQVLLRLDKGQIVGRVGAQPDRRAQFEVWLPFGGHISARQADFVTLVGHETFVGAVRGIPILTVSDGEIPILPGNGVAIVAELPTDRAHLMPAAWAWVRVSLFQPDGHAVSLPIALTRDDVPEAADQFTGESGDTLLVPSGGYKLAVALEAQPAYTLTGLTLRPAQLTEWPLTLSEIQFSFVDSNGNSLPTPALLVGVDKQTLLSPDTPILVGPKAGFTVARADTPDQTQYINDLSATPGQRLSVPVRADLFGAGGLQVKIFDVDNTLLSSNAAISIRVYQPGTEDSGVSPVSTLRNDGSTTLFPPGEYVVVVAPLRISPIAMAARYSVTIKAAQTTPLTVKLGILSIYYLDPNGSPLTPSLIYVAVADELRRLNQPIEQLRTLTPLYSYNLSPGQTTITVPAGDYAVRVQDRRAPPLKIINVPPGKVTTMFITALGPTSANTPAGTPTE